MESLVGMPQGISCLPALLRRTNLRRSGNEPFDGPKRTKTWKDPFKRNRQAANEGTRRRVFTCSMSDFFHPEADA